MNIAVFGMFSASKFRAFETVSGFAQYFDKLITNQLFRVNFGICRVFLIKLKTTHSTIPKESERNFPKKNYFESVMRK